MTKVEADAIFIKEWYGTQDAFLEAVQADYCKEQFAWSCFIDQLLRNGEIRMAEYNKWQFPGNQYKRREVNPADEYERKKVERYGGQWY